VDSITVAVRKRQRRRQITGDKIARRYKFFAGSKFEKTNPI
jgi:hypothetical protein